MTRQLDSISLCHESYDGACHLVRLQTPAPCLDWDSITTDILTYWVYSQPDGVFSRRQPGGILVESCQRVTLQGLPDYANQESGFQMSLKTTRVLHCGNTRVTALWEYWWCLSVVPGWAAAALGLMSPRHQPPSSPAQSHRARCRTLGKWWLENSFPSTGPKLFPKLDLISDTYGGFKKEKGCYDWSFSTVQLGDSKLLQTVRWGIQQWLSVHQNLSLRSYFSISPCLCLHFTFILQSVSWEWAG